jgi:hypothetical protein
MWDIGFIRLHRGFKGYKVMGFIGFLAFIIVIGFIAAKRVIGVISM